MPVGEGVSLVPRASAVVPAAHPLFCCKGAWKKEVKPNAIPGGCCPLPLWEGGVSALPLLRAGLPR